MAASLFHLGKTNWTGVLVSLEKNRFSNSIAIVADKLTGFNKATFVSFLYIDTILNIQQDKIYEDFFDYVAFDHSQVTRVLSSDERLKVELALKEREAQKNLKMVSQDLDLSDDGEGDDDSNLLGSKYNTFGEEINRLISKKAPEIEKTKSSSLGWRLSWFIISSLTFK